MAELIKVNKKVINDPLYTPVIKFLKDRIATLEETGPADELALSKQRYDGLVAGDLVIESAVTFPDNVVRVCIVSRKTGFARVDIDIKYVQMDDILTDFAIPLVEIEDVDHLKTYVKENQDIEPTLLFLKYKQTYGVLLTQDQATTHEGPMTAFGNLFFENYVTERQSLNSVDWETLESGTVTITDPSFGRGVYPLFIYELVLSEAQLPEITSNLPLSISTRRGETFSIPNTYWFAGTQDITLTATVVLSTKSGYAILERSSDKLEIDGTTIYGSATQVVTDQIVVRVTYDWNGRLVRKNFLIAMEIQKDAANDLTLTSVPTDVTCTSGDLVEVTITANYKGEVVEILIPPTSLLSQRRYGNLAYVRTKPDKSMVYRGTVTGDVPSGSDQVSDLWSAEFNYNNNGTNVFATGFVSFTIVAKETRPAFKVTGVPSALSGYLGTTGGYTPVIKYGEQEIPLTDVGLTTGVQGSKGLLSITSVTNAAVNWKIVADSGVPGVDTSDNFQQRYEWLDPYGVLQSYTFTIQVLSKVDSIVEIVPAAPQPRNVKRYQIGGPTFTLMVNGVASNGLINSLSVTNEHIGDKQYIINAANRPNQWMVILAESTEVTYTAHFSISARVDGVNKIYSYAQEFVIAKYVQGTVDPEPGEPIIPPPVDDSDPNNPGGEPAPGENGTGPGGDSGPTKPIDPNDPSKGNESDPTAPGGDKNPNSPGTTDDPNDPDSPNGPYNYDISAVPVSFTIGGNSDESYKLGFKVFQGDNDVTAYSEIMSEYTVVPEFVDFDSIVYNAAQNQFIVSYTKNKGGISQGAIFAKLKTNVNPTKKQIARLWINVDVTQIKILKVVDVPTVVGLIVDEPKDLPLSVEFSGKSITLNDPNLTIAMTGATTAKMTGFTTTGITFLNDVWNYVGTTATDPTNIILTYVDPDDGISYTTDFDLNVRTTFPPMELSYTGSQDINAKIWDAGVFPLKLMAGTKDWTSAITGTGVVTGDKYVAVNKLNWSIIFAETIPKSQIVGLRISYTVGNTVAQTLPADFKFNLAAWDGITFTSDSHTPDVIQGTAEETGEITASFIYKGNKATSAVVFNKAASTIPDNIVLGDGSYDAGRDLYVIPYTLANGGLDTLKLVFSAPDNSNITTSISINTDVTWLDQMNIVTAGDNIRGYWEDVVSYPLSVNVAGVPINLNDANMAVTFNSGAGNPLILQQTLETSLTVLLARGGTLGTTYDYAVNIGLTYTNQETGKVYNQTVTVPASIRVSAIKVGANPVISASVYQHDVIPITLVDERNNPITIRSYALTGAGNNVTLVETNNWYVTNGLTTGPTTGALPLRLGYSFGGSDYTIDVTESFNIAKWDGISYTAKAPIASLKGNGGDTGTIPFTFSYQGYPAQDSTLDLTRSTIPSNINIGELVNGNLSYTLSGQADLDMVLYFVRPNPSTPQVVGRDYAVITLPVSTKSSNLPFTLVNSDSSIALDWGKSGVINVSLKYGDNVVPANTPGLKFTLGDADVHGITITGATAAGVTVKATRSDVAGSTKIYPETINVSYEVGAPEPKTVSFDTSAAVSMGPAAIERNTQVNAEIWHTGSFQQQVAFNGIPLPSVDHFEIQNGASNKYIEITPPKGYEIVGAEPATSIQAIPLTVFYKVDGTNVLQQLNFNAPFQINGSTSVKFKVTSTPTSIQGSLNNEVTLTCTPIYKDKPAGGNATFKPDLSTIPNELTLKDYKVVGNNYVITFIGAAAGVDTMDLVFWSPGAGTNPGPSDVATVSVNVTIMGELGLEIGTRSNLLTGKSGDTGTYNFQILFGGIPIDAQAAVTAGTLTAVREVGAASSNNANVLSVTGWGPESFNYGLTGCVIPNATANVSDFINLTYRYGGTNYTARVEIPLAYTSSKPTINYQLPATVAIYKTGVVSPIITCDGITISAGFSSIQNTDDDKYIQWSAKSYTVINADITAISHGVPSRVIGQYRNWVWTSNEDIVFNIDAWDQKTFAPSITPTSFEQFLSLTGTGVSPLITLSATYQNTVLNLPDTTVYDPTRSDLKGLATLAFMGRINSNQRYQATGIRAGTETIKLCWVRPGAPVPGVENVDFGFSYLDATFKENSLIGAGSGNGAAGNGETAIINLTVKLESSGTQILNTNPNLVIKPVNEDVFKIVSMVAAQITVQITAPLSTPPGNYTVPLTFTYTDPGTGFVTRGTFDCPVTIRLPADYPVATIGADVTRDLWDYGPAPFTIKSGTTNITAQAVPIACDDSAPLLVAVPGPNPPFMVLSVDSPVTGTWWQVIRTFSVGGTSGRQVKWTVRVPYRGDTVDISVTQPYTLSGTTASQAQFQGSTTATKTLIQDIGEQVEIPFKLLWRNYKYGSAVFKPEASGTDTVKFTDHFKVISQRYDDTDGTTYLKIELTATYQGTMNFVFDMANVTDPVVGTNRAVIVTSFYDLDITDLGLNTWSMWDRRRLDTLMKISDNGTDLTLQCSVVSISSSLFVNTSGVAVVAPFIQLQSPVAVPQQQLNVVFNIKLPAAYNSRIIQVTLPETINAYDGNELTWSLTTFDNYPVAARPTAPLSPYFGLKFRGATVNFPNMSSTQALLRNVNNNQNLVFGGIGTITPSNWINYRFGSTVQFLGSIKLPVNVSGIAGTGDYPVGTLGKNYIEMQFDNIVIYENVLYLYPDDLEPAAGSAAFGSLITVPTMFSVGKNVAVNQVLPNAPGTTMTLSNAAALAGVISYNGATNNALRFNILYDNRNEDVEVNATIAARYNVSNYNGTAINSLRTYNQKLIIKGTGQGDTVTAVITPYSGKVWDVGGPSLAITQNGKAIPTSAITDIIIADNPYVRRPETSPGLTTRWWEIYNGTAAGNTVNVSITVKYTDGPVVKSYTGVVPITIAPYDGIDMIVGLKGTLSAFNNGVIAGINGMGAFKLGGTYRGTLMSVEQLKGSPATGGVFGVWQSKTVKLPSVSNILFSGSFAITDVFAEYVLFANSNDMMTSQDMNVYFGTYAKENDPTAVEGRDYVIVKVPTYVVNNNRYYPVSSDTSLTGSYGNGTATGTKYKLNLVIRKGITTIPVNTAGISVGITPSDVVTTDTANLSTNYLNTWFLSELPTSTPKITNVTFAIGDFSAGSDPALRASFPVQITQQASPGAIVVSEVNTVNAELNKSGGLPFKLSDDAGTDITSQATITGISTNDYISLQSGKWFCYNTRTGDTSIQVTITYQITYKGNLLTLRQAVPYLVKAFTGQPTVSNVQVVSAKVWDSGTVVPFVVNINGSPVPASWITAIAGTSANGRVTVTSIAKPWNVVAGDTNGPSSDTVSYVVTVNNGTTSWTVNQDVIFNIAKYDGVEFKATVREGVYSYYAPLIKSWIFGAYPAAIGSSVYLDINGTYRNALSSAPVPVFATIDTYSYLASANGITSTVRYSVRLRTSPPANTVGAFTPTIKRSAAAGTVPDVDVATITVPILYYTDINASSYFVLPETTKNLGGKFGDRLPAIAKLVYWTSAVNNLTLDFVNLVAKGATVTFSSVIEMVPGSLTTNGFNVRFLANVTAQTVTTVTASVVTPEGTFTWPIVVTQEAGAVVPELTVQSPTTISG